MKLRTLTNKRRVQGDSPFRRAFRVVSRMKQFDRFLQKLGVQPLYFLIIPAFLYSVVTGLFPALTLLASEFQQISTSTTEELRSALVPWYQREKKCFAHVAATVGPAEPVLLSVDNVPHWFAPYYLSPRPFYYDREEARARLLESGANSWVLQLSWRAGTLECDLTRLSSTQKTMEEK